MAVAGVSRGAPVGFRVGQGLDLPPQVVGSLKTAFVLSGVLPTPILRIPAHRWCWGRILVLWLIVFGLASIEGCGPFIALNGTALRLG